MDEVSTKVCNGSMAYGDQHITNYESQELGTRKFKSKIADLTWHAIYSSIVGFYGNNSTCDDLLVLKLQVHKFLSSDLV